MMLEVISRQVYDFHVAAGQPVGHYPRALTTERHLLRVKWMEEEVEELAAAKGVVDQVDAVCDLLYFALGSLVEMGATKNLCSIYGQIRPTGAPQALDDAQKANVLHTVQEILSTLSGAANMREQEVGLHRVIESSVKTCQQMNIYVADVFDCIHAANMDKFIDGAQFNEEGKIIKPEGWVGPEARIAELLGVSLEPEAPATEEKLAEEEVVEKSSDISEDMSGVVTQEVVEKTDDPLDTTTSSEDAPIESAPKRGRKTRKTK